MSDIPNPETDYRESESLNQSSLSILEESPRDFKKLIDGELEDQGDKSTDRGDLVHKLALQPHLVPMGYAVVEGEIPSHKSQTAFVEELPKDTEPTEEDVIEAYKAAYSVKSKSDKKIKEEAESAFEKFKDYYYAIKLRGDREVITQKDYNTAADSANELLNHPVIGDLLSIDNQVDTMIEAPFEFAVDNTEYTRLSSVLKYRADDLKEAFYPLYNRIVENNNPINLKGKLDKVDINHDSRTIKITDIKSTTKTFKRFLNEFFTYNLDLQASLYTEAVFYYLFNELGYSFSEVKEFHIEFYFAVVNVNKPEARVFYVSDNTMDNGLTKMINLLNDYVWHVNNDLWEAKPIEYEKGGVEI